MMKIRQAFSALLAAALLKELEAFNVIVPTSSSAASVPCESLYSSCFRTTTTARFMADTWEGAGPQSSGGGAAGSLEQIEFKIYPDGRVEETVHGIKGGDCLSVTEKINEVLGEVVASRPTEEMYEQEIVTDQTLYQSTSESEWDGSSSW